MEHNLTRLRKQKGITQEQLAEMVGVSRNHITRIETGSRNGSIFLYTRIAKSLNVSMGDIFFTHNDDCEESKGG